MDKFFKEALRAQTSIAQEGDWLLGYPESAEKIGRQTFPHAADGLHGHGER